MAEALTPDPAPVRLTIDDQVVANALAFLVTGFAMTEDAATRELARTVLSARLARASRNHAMDPLTEAARALLATKDGSLEESAARHTAYQALQRFFFWRLALAEGAAQARDTEVAA